MIYRPWTEKETERYFLLRPKDGRLEKLYELAKVSSEPEKRAAFLTRNLKLTESDFLKLYSECHGDRPLELKKLEEMLLSKLARDLK